MTDKQKTAFFFVCVPEEMILIDPHKADQLFAKYDVPLSGYIVNRVLTDELMQQPNNPAYLRNRYTMQQEYSAKINTLFGDDVLAWVPEFERDITDLPMSDNMANGMFGNATA